MYTVENIIATKLCVCVLAYFWLGELYTVEILHTVYIAGVIKSL